VHLSKSRGMAFSRPRTSKIHLRLTNHSIRAKTAWNDRESNPGSPPCEGGALPLCHHPLLVSVEGLVKLYIPDFERFSVVANATLSEGASVRLSVCILGVEIRHVLPTKSLSQIDIQSGSGIPRFEPTISVFFEALCSLGVGHISSSKNNTL
jgi:hypothetical protein